MVRSAVVIVIYIFEMLVSFCFFQGYVKEREV